LSRGELIVQTILSVGQVSARVLTGINLVFSIVLSVSLNHLLSMIDTYQILVLMSLFNLIMPGNARIFFA